MARLPRLYAPRIPQLVEARFARPLAPADAPAPAAALDLSGQGLRDVTRIAASDAPLWTSILAANAAAVRSVLMDLRADLDVVIDALGEADGSHGTLGTGSGPFVFPSRARGPARRQAYRRGSR